MHVTINIRLTKMEVVLTAGMTVYLNKWSVRCTVLKGKNRWLKLHTSCTLQKVPNLQGTKIHIKQ